LTATVSPSETFLPHPTTALGRVPARARLSP
jgi:hypothetical protein